MHSTAIVLGLLAGSVFSSPTAHGRGHMHNARQVEVVDVVDVYTTVTIGGTAPTPAPAAPPPPPPKPEEKLAAPPKHVAPKPQVAEVKPASSAAPPPPPPSSAATTPSSGNAFVDLHNKNRAAHGAGPIAWDDALAAKAQGQANGCPNGDVGCPPGDTTCPK